jgi:hypothetical protein
MSVPPKGAGPRGTLPLEIGLALSSPCASRHIERPLDLVLNDLFVSCSE